MTKTYFPAAGSDWERQEPEAAGFDSAALQAAVDHAVANETGWDRDIMKVLTEGHFEPPPYNEILGPVRERGGPNGLILKGGRIVAEWGDTNRADMTFSVSKSYLSICAGLAIKKGLIKDIHAPIRELVQDGGFDSAQNRDITWHHLLQQTSEWEGTLWDKPDLLDRHRDLTSEGASSKKGTHRDLQKPGSFWEYNDIRVNRLSLALLRVLGEGLPAVLKREVMDPIGASQDWEWHGYRNSYVEIGGKQVQSVSGGGHWGGGMMIGSRDHARVGLLMANKGKWNGTEILPESWIDASLQPCDLQPIYGYMWWLNTGRKQYPSAPETSFFAVGAGNSIIWMDPAHDLVAVVRWIGKPGIDGFCRRVMEAMR